MCDATKVPTPVKADSKARLLPSELELSDVDLPTSDRANELRPELRQDLESILAIEDGSTAWDPQDPLDPDGLATANAGLVSSALELGWTVVHGGVAPSDKGRLECLKGRHVTVVFKLLDFGTVPGRNRYEYVADQLFFGNGALVLKVYRDGEGCPGVSVCGSEYMSPLPSEGSVLAMFRSRRSSKRVVYSEDLAPFVLAAYRALCDVFRFIV